MTAQFRLTTLGAINLRDREDRPVREVLAQPKRVALLAYLALESRRGPVPRDRLLGLFWPEADDARARNSLSQALHQLRQALGAELIESVGAGLVVDAGALWCDAVAFQELLDRGALEEALALYAGEFCPALFADSSELERWLDGVRQRCRTRAHAAARMAAEARAKGNDAAAIASAARRGLALEPEDEADVRVYLTLLDRAGDQAGALFAYDEFARRLKASLEIEPAPETRALADGIRQRRPPRPPEPPPAPAMASAAPPAAVEPPPLPPAAAPPRWRMMLAVTLLLAVAGAAAAFTLVGSRWRTREQTVRTVAVFPFQVRGGRALGYLGEGMVDLLSVKLGGAAGFHVIDPRSVIAAVGDRAPGLPAADAAKLARTLGAGWYLSGDVVEVAGRLQINGTLYDLGAGPDPVATGSVVGDTAALFELVDDLTGRMLVGLTHGRDTTLTRLAAATTHSLPALKSFLEGERALREGRDAEAASAFRAASDLDTNFALAQYRLAVAATWVSVPDIPDPALWAERAARHANRLPPLGRDLLDAYRAYKAIRGAEAEQRYRAITAAHPDNVEAWFMLGEVVFHYLPFEGRSPLDAWPCFERVLALDPDNLHALIHLIRLAASDARLATLDSLVDRYAARTPDATRLLEVRAIRAYAHGDAAGRRAITADARGVDGVVLWGLVQAATGIAPDAEAARSLAPAMLQAESYPWLRAYTRLGLSTVELMTGRWDRAATIAWLGAAMNQDWLLESEALLAAEPLVALPRAQVQALRDSVAARARYPLMQRPGGIPLPDVGLPLQAYLLGLLDARLGDTLGVRRGIATLEGIRDSGWVIPSGQLAHGLRAELRRARGDLAGALAEVNQVPGIIEASGGGNLLHWGMRERFARAELLHALGRDEEALPVYESFALPLDSPFLALAHMRRGEILAARGERARAVGHLQRFVTLWRDADPALQPLVSGARARLAGLTAPPP